MTQRPTLFVCALCKSPASKSPASEALASEALAGQSSGGQHLIDQLSHHLDAAAIALQPVRCMAACDRACNAALSAPGKLTFIFNDLSPQDAAATLAAFCEQYAATADGRVPYALRSPAIRQATAYVLPPLLDGAAAIAR
jgi:predicted metal-binding protein